MINRSDSIRIKLQNKKIEYISNIKAIAILMVVFLHSVSPLYYQFGNIESHNLVCHCVL